jgi:hypothetical protein
VAFCAGFGFAMFDFAMSMIARAYTFELDDADFCFKEMCERARLVRPLRESIA